MSNLLITYFKNKQDGSEGVAIQQGRIYIHLSADQLTHALNVFNESSEFMIAPEEFYEEDEQ